VKIDVAFREKSTVDPVSMHAEPIAEKVSDSGGRNCVATTPECLAPQQPVGVPDQLDRWPIPDVILKLLPGILKLQR
jgi:hypothetical protein